MSTKSSYIEIKMHPRKRIALVAHDNKKQELIDWALCHRPILAEHDVFATGTTGRIIEAELGIKVHRVHSGPLGGDQQIGSKISEGLIDFLVFFWDPIAPKPHDPDVKALLRMAVIWNIPVACNCASADFILQSPHMKSTYSRNIPRYDEFTDADPMQSWVDA